MRVTHLIGVLTLMAPIGATTVAAQGSFEGVVTYRGVLGNDADTSGTTVYSAKGPKSRTDVTLPVGSPTAKLMGATLTTLYDASTGKTTWIVPKMKAFMDMTSMLSQAQGKMDSAMNEMTFKKTGSETVAGISCDDYEAADAKGQTTFACVAHGMGTWAYFDNSHASSKITNTTLASLFKKGFFPLKLGKVENGKQIAAMVATSVEKKTVAASLFAPPSDYQDATGMSPDALMKAMKSDSK